MSTKEVTQFSRLELEAYKPDPAQMSTVKTEAMEAFKLYLERHADEVAKQTGGLTNVTRVLVRRDSEGAYSFGYNLLYSLKALEQRKAAAKKAPKPAPKPQASKPARRPRVDPRSLDPKTAFDLALKQRDDQARKTRHPQPTPSKPSPKV